MKIDHHKQRQLERYQRQLQGEIDAFNNFKRECIVQAEMFAYSGGTCPSPPRDCKEQLAKGIIRIRELKAAIGKLSEELGVLSTEDIKRTNKAIEIQQGLASKRGQYIAEQLEKVNYE